MGINSDSFDIAFTEVKKLVDKFNQGIKHYLSPSYNETEVRKDFIDKFFIVLGWDVNHDIQQDPYQQEVKVEKTQDNQKRTDYTFYLFPNFKDTKFYVEAKKPSQNLRNADYYFQTIRYGWNSKTPIVVLTDFEEFHILDCRIRPDINKVIDGFHKQYYYTDYLEKEKFSEIYYLFSHESVTADSLERYADSLPKPKGKASEKGFVKIKLQTIDEEFLEYIDRTRESLAKAFKKNDENLGSEELTEATQRTIDRLVFIRFLEDKLIEQDNYVSEFGKSNKAWIDFITACRRLDSKYNGIVFKKHFIDEQNFRGPELNEFKNICNEISHLNSPYDFNAIPIHILGSIYERFLGKVVHATDKRVKVEEKPEVRKAGGVYYTPKYIVDYIVDNTIGKILRNEDSTPLVPMLPRGNVKGKTPAEISKLRFADIACGSGSFLIGVFETLLDYHNKYYQQHKAQAKKDGCIEKDGIMVLSIKQKQNILLNNIYGVDIDQQAVEVTQLSLALKMLEDETTATANDMQVLFHEKILPDLSNNIICGNSLIGTDILSGSMFASEDERKLNPMDFETTFPEIMKNGGFDAIVGNPPYVNIENLDDITKNYYFNNYNTCVGRTDIYIVFIEKALKLLNKNGLLSYIIPFAFTNQVYGTLLRKYIIQNYKINEIVDTSDYFIFDSANVKNIIISIEKLKKSKSLTTVKRFLNEDSFVQQISYKYFKIEQDNFLSLKDCRLETKDLIKLIPIKEKMHSLSVPFYKICLIAYGVRINHKNKNIGKDYYISLNYKSGYKHFCEGKNIDRYYFEQYGWLNYKPTEHYNPMFPELFENEKLMFINVVKDRLRFCFDNEDTYNSHTVINCVRIDKLKNANHISARNILNESNLNFCKNYSYYYLLGILNSNIINWYFVNFLSESLHFYPNDAKNLPIKEINFQNETEKQAHDKIVQLVEQMLESKKQLQLIKTDKDKTYYERKCETLDNQIDSEVYKLYGLTEEEIKIVEDKNEGK
ncbi:MAG TPA: DNA methyltransferase [Ignavibacteria bacterium]